MLTSRYKLPATQPEHRDHSFPQHQRLRTLESQNPLGERIRTMMLPDDSKVSISRPHVVECATPVEEEEPSGIVCMPSKKGHEAKMCDE